MKWLIGIAVLAFMAAPLIWMIPTPRQAREAKIRERARQLGMQVKIHSMPQTRRQRVRREDEQIGVCYCLPLSRRCDLPGWRYWLREEAYGDDDTPRPATGVVEAVKRLREYWPEDASLIEFTGFSLQIFWLERGADEQRIETLAEGLRKLLKELDIE